MIVENQLDRRAGWIGGIKKLEEFDELAAAVAISDEGMNLPGEQIDPGQQAAVIVPGAFRTQLGHSRRSAPSSIPDYLPQNQARNEFLSAYSDSQRRARRPHSR